MVYLLRNKWINFQPVKPTGLELRPIILTRSFLVPTFKFAVSSSSVPIRASKWMWRRKRKKKLRIFTAKALRSILLHSFAIFKYAISHLHAYILLSLDLDYEEFSRPILDYIKIFYFLFFIFSWWEQAGLLLY